MELRTAAAEGKYEEEGWRIRKDGSRFWASVVITALRDEHGELRGFGKVTRDMSERRRADERVRRLNADLERRVAERTAELAASNEELQHEVAVRRRIEEERLRLLADEQSARAEAEKANRFKDEFLWTLSHELRTPLNAIVGWVHLLNGAGLDNDERREGLDVIERNSQSLSALIRDLTDVSRIASGKLVLDVKRVDLGAVAAAAVAGVGLAAEAKGLALETAIDADCGQILGDPDRLQQVAWNLLSNAIKFTPKGGRVDVRLTRKESSVVLTVSDTGRGLSAAFLPHIFERFRQADSTITRQYGGLGLGLAIVKHLVELHGGTVVASSPGENRGATFTVSIPVRAVAMERPAQHQDPTKASEPTAQAAGAAQGAISGLRVLVVDDEADARALVSFVLRRHGADAMPAGSAGEAWALLEQRPFDVLLSDLGMPLESGYELIRRLRAWEAERGRRRLPAVALTAFAGRGDADRALADGFDLHVSKPVDPAALVAAVAVLARRNVGRPR
jgi:signal transduction histidine kinase/ActR/RegA family two-component response regulator